MLVTETAKIVSVVLQFPSKAAVDRQLVKKLEDLLEEAKAGKITGLAYVAIEPGPEYTADVCGIAIRAQTTVALVAAAKLQAAVFELINATFRYT